MAENKVKKLKAKQVVQEVVEEGDISDLLEYLKIQQQELLEW